MYDNQALLNYIKDRRYSECITILKNKITSFVIEKIKPIDNTISYTTVNDLINISDFYLNDSNIARKLQMALMHENALAQVENLLLICEENNIK